MGTTNFVMKVSSAILYQCKDLRLKNRPLTTSRVPGPFSRVREEGEMDADSWTLPPNGRLYAP